MAAWSLYAIGISVCGRDIQVILTQYSGWFPV